jgi:hypothetical protein
VEVSITSALNRAREVAPAGAVHDQLGVAYRGSTWDRAIGGWASKEGLV